MILEHYVLDKYRIDSYFLHYRLAVEVDEFNHANRISDDEREK